MNITITAAEKSDCKALADLSARTFSQPMSEQEFARELDVKFSHTLTALADDEPVGFINIWIVSGNADLNNIAVSEGFRHKGIGQQLLDASLLLCKGCKTMTLEVRESNSPAIAFYRKNSFKQAGRRKGFYSYPTEDALIYTLDIQEKKMNDITSEKLGSEIEIFINSEHRFGTDAFLLSDFAGGRHKDMVCDFCTGSGIVALLTYKNFAPMHIDAVEIQPQAHELLKMTVDKNSIGSITPILCDLKEYRSTKELDLITCNPPYKISGTGAKNDNRSVSIARHEVLCTIEDVCKAAARNLKFGGRLCICQRPERLADIFSQMRAAGLEPKRLRTVHKNPDGAPWLVLVEGKKGAKPFLNIEKPLYVCGEGSEPSQEMQRIYGFI